MLRAFVECATSVLVKRLQFRVWAKAQTQSAARAKGQKVKSWNSRGSPFRELLSSGSREYFVERCKVYRQSTTRGLGVF